MSNISTKDKVDLWLGDQYDLAEATIHDVFKHDLPQRGQTREAVVRYLSSSNILPWLLKRKESGANDEFFMAIPEQKDGIASTYPEHGERIVDLFNKRFTKNRINLLSGDIWQMHLGYSHSDKMELDNGRRYKQGEVQIGILLGDKTEPYEPGYNEHAFHEPGLKFAGGDSDKQRQQLRTEKMKEKLSGRTVEPVTISAYVAVNAMRLLGDNMPLLDAKTETKFVQHPVVAHNASFTTLPFHAGEIPIAYTTAEGELRMDFSSSEYEKTYNGGVRRTLQIPVLL